MLPFKYSPKFGFIFNTIAIIITSFLNIVPKLYFGYKLLPYEIKQLNSIQDMKASLMRYQSFTDQYLVMFIIGIIIGYIIREKNSFIKYLVRNKFWSILLSFICYSLPVLALIWSQDFSDINKTQNKLNINLWFIFGKILWSFGNIWLIFVIYFNKNGMKSNEYSCDKNI